MISAPSPSPVFFGMNRNLAIVGSVVIFHVAALWALQTGLLRRVAEIVVPAEVLSEFISPAAPKAETPPAPQPPATRPTVRQRQSVAPPAPQPTAMPEATATPLAPVGVTAPQPPPLPVLAGAVTTTPATPAPAAAPARIELPSSDADYLNNPKPAYPALSKRLGEQGKVVVRVLIGVDGLAQKAEIRTSSGFERLDQAALATVLKWRYVPGKRGGVPEAMWFNIPVNFVLE
jgi:periplasmic protein TonB